MAHYECRFCDRPSPYCGPHKVDGDLICMCGAEWEGAKLLVEDDKFEEEDDFMHDEPSDWENNEEELEATYDDLHEDDRLLSCGCHPCCCDCHLDEIEEDEED